MFFGEKKEPLKGIPNLYGVQFISIEINWNLPQFSTWNMHVPHKYLRRSLSCHPRNTNGQSQRRLLQQPKIMRKKVRMTTVMIGLKTWWKYHHVWARWRCFRLPLWKGECWCADAVGLMRKLHVALCTITYWQFCTYNCTCKIMVEFNLSPLKNIEVHVNLGFLVWPMYTGGELFFI